MIIIKQVIIIIKQVNRLFLFILLKFVKIPEFPVYKLDSQTLIDHGSNRECHIHPANPSLCIKVPRDPDDTRMKEPNTAEWCWAKMLDRRKISTTKHRPLCYGWVNTNYGPGLIMDRVYDTKRQTSIRLTKFIREYNPTKNLIIEMIEELKIWAFANKIPVDDIGTCNLLIKWNDDCPYIVLVDGIGDGFFRRYILIFLMLPNLTIWFTRRLWQKQERELYQDIDKHFNRKVTNIPEIVGTSNPEPS